MVRVFYRVFNGYKIKFCRAYFCIGIGMDQLTPTYYKYSIGRSLGPVKKEVKACPTKTKLNVGI